MNAQAEEIPSYVLNEIARLPVERQEVFTKAIADGSGYRFAQMLAVRRGPGVRTDATYYRGQGTLEQQFEGAPCGALETLIASAKAHGYKPNIHDVYDAGLARFHGDPQAFVPPVDARLHIRQVCEERGVACSGPVTVKRRELENPPENCRLAPDIANEIVDYMIHENPELRYKADRRELLEEAVLKHGFDDSKLTGQLSKDIHAPPAETT